MANFTLNATAGLSTSDGISISRVLTGVNANAKALLDDTFGPGPISVDFAPLVASILTPDWALLLCDGDGAKLKFDGAAAFTTKNYKTAMFQLAVTPGGVLDLEIEAAGPAQRIRFLCVGDA
jgi:hypothetical protein